MTELDFDQERLEELLLGAAGTEFSDENRSELNAILKRSASARAFAARHLILDATLSDYLLSESVERSYAEKQESALGKIIRFPFQRRTWVAATAAIALIVFSFQVLQNEPLDPPSKNDPIAVVHNANFIVPYLPGETFDMGDWIRFDQGRMMVRFRSGAKLAVEGPAAFQIVSDNGAEMILGRATIRVPGKIKGFTLDTPSERVVDLGTSFGVEVERGGATSIAVFEGEIELQGAQYAAGPQTLLAGASVRVEGGGGNPLEIPYDVADYLNTWQASFGVEVVEGDLRVSDPTERGKPGLVVDPDHLLLFPEREFVPLSKEFRVNAIEPGKYANKGRSRRIKQTFALERALHVDSYLLQFSPGAGDSDRESRRFVGSLRFDRPIVGLLLSKELLDDSDELLGLSGSEFEGTFRRGINSEDSVVLDADRRSLSISFDTYQGIDQIRVLVASSVE